MLSYSNRRLSRAGTNIGGSLIVKNIYAALILLAVATASFAGTLNTPEIDGSTAAGAIALISGSALVLRSRRKR